MNNRTVFTPPSRGKATPQSGKSNQSSARSSLSKQLQPSPPANAKSADEILDGLLELGLGGVLNVESIKPEARNAILAGVERKLEKVRREERGLEELKRQLVEAGAGAKVEG